MATLIIPNTWSSGEIPTAADMNQNFAEVANSANNVADAQIAADAGIAGTKVAALATANFEDASFPQSKLAKGVTTFGQLLVQAAAQSVSITGTETLVASQAQARAGGGMLILGTVWIQVDGDTFANTVRLRLLEDGAPIAADQVVTLSFDASWEHGVQLSVMLPLAPAVVVSKTFALGVTRTVGSTTIVCTGWQLMLWELR
jgi:hypothetical protein